MTTKKPQIKIVDCETNEEVIRDANTEEIAEMESKSNSLAALQAEAEAKATARAAILNRLGLTPDEAAILLG